MSDKRRFQILFSGLAALAILLLGLTSYAPAREAIRNFFFGQQRIILAKAQGDLTGKGMNVVVIKVKTADTLSLEIYDLDTKTENTGFRSRIILSEKRDAFINYQDNVINLVLADVDKDGSLEIVAPTFDENLVPRLNVYKFQESSQGFDRMGPDSFQL